MLIRAVIVWVLGLLTFVPYGIYHLLFHAPREQYALLISGILFWIFAYWAIVTPLISVYRIKNLMKLLETANSAERIKEIIREEESEKVIIELLAKENNIPESLARKLYYYAIEKFRQPGKKDLA